MEIRIGTSGFVYQDWKGKFYPSGLRPDKYLQYYSARFSTVEINSSFYYLPRKKTITNWKDITPPEFVFAIKASRFITHLRKLNDSSNLLKQFLELFSPLKEKLGPILFQLPPQMEINIERLKEFIKLLPYEYRYVFEFRNSSWYNDKTYELLNYHNCAMCLHDHKDAPSPDIITTDFLYIRFHGPDGRYLQKYDNKYLKMSAKFITSQSGINKVYCYFNNDTLGYALDNAETMERYLSISPIG